MYEPEGNICLDPRILNTDEETQQRILDLIKICGLTLVVETDPPNQSEFFRRASRGSVTNIWEAALRTFEIRVRAEPNLADFGGDGGNDSYFKKYAPHFFATSQIQLQQLIRGNSDKYFYFEGSTSLAYRETTNGTILGAGISILKSPRLSMLGQICLKPMQVEKTSEGKERIRGLCREFGSTNSVIKIYDKLLMLKLAHRLNAEPDVRHRDHIDSYDLIEEMCNGSKVKTIEIYTHFIEEEADTERETISLNMAERVYLSLKNLIEGHGKKAKIFVLNPKSAFNYTQGNISDGSFIIGSSSILNWPHFSVCFTHTGRTRVQAFNSSQIQDWIKPDEQMFLQNSSNLVDFDRLSV